MKPSDDFDWPSEDEIARQARAAGRSRHSAGHPGSPDDSNPSQTPGPANQAPHPGEPRSIQPSLWAAIDAPAKVIGAGIIFLLPFYISASLQGESFRPLAIVAGLGSLNLLYALLVPLAPAVQLAFTRYHIDEEGIRIHTQILTRTERRVSWEKVTALQHRRTILDRAFGIARVDVIAYGQRGATLQLVGLRDAAWLRNLVAKRMRENASVDALLRSD